MIKAVEMIYHPLSRLNIQGEVLFNESMARHCSFKVGGPADVFLRPQSREDLRKILGSIEDDSVPIYPLGEGANVLVSDKGIRGIVIDMSAFRGVDIHGGELSAEAGLSVSNAAEHAASAGLAGMAFLYAMPGSIGGSVWMNARCYGRSVSDILSSVEVMDRKGNIEQVNAEKLAFSYKRSPFQKTNDIILKAAFRLETGNPEVIRSEMADHSADRERKGHFLYPSVGSVFKNNRAFGMPTGKIIDELSLKGRQIGGARIADYHANIIINTGTASAEDILNLVEYIERKVFEKRGFQLEREIILLGEWEGRK